MINKLSIKLQTKYNKCYKKYCNKIITKKQLSKKLIKQFNNFEKGKNNKNEKNKNLSLIMKTDKCIKDHCSLKKEKYFKYINKIKKLNGGKTQLNIYQK